MKIKPLTAEEVERVKWHIKAYGLCQELHDELITDGEIRAEVDRCPDEYREHFRHWLNHYRKKFKEYREWRKRNGVGISTVLGGTLK